MPQVEGQIEKVYHNFNDRNNNPLPPNKVNHKIKMMGELYIIKGSYCPDFVQEGKRVSIAYNVWNNPQTKMDNFYVLTKDNKLCINDLSSNPQTVQEAEPELDDDISGTEFPVNVLEKQNSNPQQLKDMQIFCTALLKSSIEGGKLEPTKENINRMILDLKAVYKENFK